MASCFSQAMSHCKSPRLQQEVQSRRVGHAGVSRLRYRRTVALIRCAVGVAQGPVREAAPEERQAGADCHGRLGGGGHDGAWRLHKLRWYEGSIIRSADGRYEIGHRSYSLLKLKDFQDAEFKVVGVEHGKGSFEDKAILVLGSKARRHLQRCTAGER
jgi:hypothetical protein